MQRQNNVNAQPGMPQVAIIVAMTKGQVIGSGEDLPWNLPDDLQLFKRLTRGCTVIMGRKTYASIGRPLPERHNIVLSRTREELPGVQICESFIIGLTAAAQLGHPVFIIGGEDIYRKALPIATELHISWVKGEFIGDRFFPSLDFSEWTVYTEKDYPDFHYIHYRRRITE